MTSEIRAAGVFFHKFCTCMVAAASICSIFDGIPFDNFLVLSIFSSSLLEGGKTSASELSW